MILVIDNYDSFTFNLVQALAGRRRATVRVVRNDAIDRAGVEALADDPAADLRGIVISPGPGDPDDAGVSVDDDRGRRRARDPAARRVPRACSRWRRPSAASIVRAPTLVHGEASEVTHDGAGPARGHAAVVHGRPLPLAVRRRRRRCPPELRVTAMSEVGPRRHGHPPRLAAARGRPVPPRERAHAGGPAPARELPAPGRRRARRRGSTPRPARSRRPGMAEAVAERRPMSEHVRAALATIVDGGTLSMDEARARDGRGHGRRGDAGPAGGAAAGACGCAARPSTSWPASRRRCASASLRVEAPDGRDRRRRHRRRRQRHVQHLDRRGARRRRGRRAGRQARQPGDHLASRARPTCSRRSGVRIDHDADVGRRGAARASASRSCSRPTSTRRCGTPARPAARSASGPRSTCSAR